ncbi:hypothetical protein KP509_02G047100 [Ceratopteris richardii]|uniref:Uncharacterized protein n=1 Tax=Ceratopteris richardii TaxID=49495 RepID=A0A8T2V919_CERRI|nr:hypothetical protein KP509_02G047100 [Ceratopteris richardii]
MHAKKLATLSLGDWLVGLVVELDECSRHFLPWLVCKCKKASRCQSDVSGNELHILAVGFVNHSCLLSITPLT